MSQTHPKTYTVTNPREWSETKIHATCRRDWVASMVKKFPEAVESYKVQMTPYRYEPHHAAEQSQIDDCKESKGLPGIPVTRDDILRQLEEFRDTKVRVTFADDDESDTQVLKVSGSIRTYELHVDTSVVRWVLPNDEE